MQASVFHRLSLPQKLKAEARGPAIVCVWFVAPTVLLSAQCFHELV